MPPGARRARGGIGILPRVRKVAREIIEAGAVTEIGFVDLADAPCPEIRAASRESAAGLYSARR